MWWGRVSSSLAGADCEQGDEQTNHGGIEDNVVKLRCSAGRSGVEEHSLRRDVGE